MTEFKIEKGIPVPPKTVKTGFAPTVRKMEIGDSMFVAGKTPANVWSAIASLKPMKFTTRKEEGGTRMWRIE